MSFNERTIALIGEDNIKKLNSKKVIVFGVGGVGGYVVEMLARSNIGEITLVDFDVVSESNINRQIIATTQSINKLKVECIKDRILAINPNCKVNIFAEKLTTENISIFNLKKYDFVIDCIDMVTSKIALIKFCYDNKIKIISSMGAGNRFELPKFEICDIFKTENDGLAKAIRSKLRSLGVKRSLVCYSKQNAKKQKVIGSIAYFPASCGINIAAYVINYFIKEN
jgi:tRNA A37 threonylcarbamoyladenosine dehydratase